MRQHLLSGVFERFENSIAQRVGRRISFCTGRRLFGNRYGSARDALQPRHEGDRSSRILLSGAVDGCARDSGDLGLGLRLAAAIGLERRRALKGDAGGARDVCRFAMQCSRRRLRGALRTDDAVGCSEVWATRRRRLPAGLDRLRRSAIASSGSRRCAWTSFSRPSSRWKRCSCL